MINNTKIAQMEQALAEVKEVLPALWRGLYDGCIEKKFTEAQALELVKTYILAAYGPARS